MKVPRTIVIAHASSVDKLSQNTTIPDLVTLTLYLFKNFDLGHNLWTMIGLSYSYLYSLLLALSHHTIIFDIVTLKFDLLFKNFTIGHYNFMNPER